MKDKDLFGMWAGAALATGLACFAFAFARADRAPFVLAGLGALVTAAAAAALRSGFREARQGREELRAALGSLEQSLAAAPKTAETGPASAEFAAAAQRIENSVAGISAALAAQGEKLRAAAEEGLRAGWGAAGPTLSAGFAGPAQTLAETAERLGSFLEAGAQSARAFEKAAGALPAAAQTLAEASQAAVAASRALETAGDAVESMRKSADAGLREAGERAAATLQKLAEQAAATLQIQATQADTRLQASAAQAETWLQSLAQAGSGLEAVFREAKASESAAVAQAEALRGVVDSLRQPLADSLERAQTLAQGQADLLEKMEAAIRRFEERSAEILEETALAAQETLLDALDRSAESEVPALGAEPASETRG